MSWSEHVGHHPSRKCETCSAWPLWWQDLAIRIETLRDEQRRGFTMTQAAIDAATAALNGVADELGTVDTEIQALKAANPEADTSQLEAAVGRVKAAADVDLGDAAAPAAPVTPPATDASGNPVDDTLPTPSA